MHSVFSSALNCFMHNINNMHKFYIVDLPVEVDRQMVPVVKWLNSHKDTRTLYCCQGDHDKKEPAATRNRPYIMFVCGNPKSLHKIMDGIEKCRHHDDSVTISMDYHTKRIRYTIRWKDVETFKKTKGTLCQA